MIYSANNASLDLSLPLEIEKYALQNIIELK